MSEELVLSLSKKTMKILTLDFARIYQLKQKDGTALSLADDLVVFDMDPLTDKNLFNLDYMPPLRIDARVYFLCRKGEMTFHINYTSYRLSKGSMFRLNGRHIIENIRTSDDYQGYALIFSHDFIHSIINWVPELKELVVSADRFKPLLTFDDRELHRFTDMIENVKDKLKATDHTFYSQLVKVEATEFILELASRFAQKLSDKSIFIGKQHQGEETLRQFMHLVMDHCKEQHEVSFYADKLYTTPGNLSKTITKASGRPPLKWINDALTAEAKILLRNPDMNVQQVAEELYFGDQSSFGKFFKRHTGLTPIAYKNNLKHVELF